MFDNFCAGAPLTENGTACCSPAPTLVMATVEMTTEAKAESPVVRREDDLMEETNIKEMALPVPPQEPNIIDSVAQFSHRAMADISSRFFNTGQTIESTEMGTLVEDENEAETPAPAPASAPSPSSSRVNRPRPISAEVAEEGTPTPGGASPVAGAGVFSEEAAPPKAAAESLENRSVAPPTELESAAKVPGRRRASVTGAAKAVAKAPAKGMRRVSTYLASAADDLIREVDELFADPKPPPRLPPTPEQEKEAIEQAYRRYSVQALPEVQQAVTDAAASGAIVRQAV